MKPHFETVVDSTCIDVTPQDSPTGVGMVKTAVSVTTRYFTLSLASHALVPPAPTPPFTSGNH